MLCYNARLMFGPHCRMKGSPFLLTLILVLGLMLQTFGAACLADPVSLDAQMDGEGRAFFVAKSAFDDGFLRESRVQLKGILDKYPATRFRLEIYFLLGQIALSEKNYERAQVHFRRILRAPENPFKERAQFYLGQSYHASGKDAQALRAMQELLDKHPFTGYVAIARLTMGKSLRRMGRWEEARESFAKVASDFAGTTPGAWALVEQAKGFQAQGKFIRAADSLSALSASALNPLKPGESELWLGNCFRAAKQWVKALEWYGKTQEKSVPEGIRARGLLAKAATLVRTGDFAGAAAAYAEYGKQYPKGRDAGWAAMGLARLKLRAGDWDDAARLAKAATTGAAVKGPRLREEALFLRCRIALARKEYPESLRLCRSFLARYPESPYAEFTLYGVAQSLFYAGEYEQSQKALEACLAAGASGDLRRRILLMQGDAMSLLSRPDDAIAAYKRVLSEYPSDAKADEVLHRLGYCHYQNKRWDEASEVLRKLWEKYPASPWADSALYRLGWIRLQKGAYADAAEYFRMLREKSPEGIYAEQALYQEGVCRYRLHDYAKAGEAFAGVLTKFPQGPLTERALLESGWTFAVEGKDKEASAAFEKFLRQFPSGPMAPQALFWLGEDKLRRMDYAASEGFFERLVRESPRSDLADDALYSWAVGLAQTGRHDDATRILHRLLDEYPSSDLVPDARFAVAENEAAMKHYAQAIKLFNRIIADGGENGRGKEAAMRIADCQFARGAFAKALDAYTKLSDADDAFVAAQARFKKAITWEALGDAGEAKSDLLEVLYGRGARKPWADKAALRLGEIFEREGRMQDALTLYGNVLEAGGRGDEADAARERVEQLKRGGF